MSTPGDRPKPPIAIDADGALLDRHVDKQSPKQHYTQLTPHVHTRVHRHDDGSVFEIRGGGIVSPAMIERTLGQWDAGCAPSNLLVDLRDVVGYEAGSIRVADQWLDRAPDQGVQKVALLASSTVLATAAQLASRAFGRGAANVR